MKVLLVNGGPHKNGSTNAALGVIAAELQKYNIETEIYWLGVEPIAGCIGCGSCFKTHKCFRNDKVNELADRLEEFDGFVFGSPVHYAAISGALSSFMDRLFYTSSIKMRGKPAAAVVSCRRGGASAAFDEINKYFTISSMPIVSSQYWNQIHGSNAEEAMQDEEGVQTMRTLGANMAYLIRCIDAGKKAGIEMPARERITRTNFIR